MTPSLRSRSLAGPLALLVLAACGGTTPPSVSVGAVQFSERDVLGLSDDRRLLLGELAAFGLATADSALADLGRPWREARAREHAWRLYRAERVLDSAGVGDEVLSARYRTQPELELTVRHLLVFSPRYETEPTRAAARDKAAAALERIRAGEDLAAVAAEVSEEPGAESRAGLLTPGREGAWVDEFWNAAVALEPGQVSGVVETQYGFHVLRLEGRDTVPFDEARRRVALDVAAMMSDLDAVVPPDPGGLALAPGLASLYRDADADPATEVATWEDGGALSLAGLRDAAALLPYARRRTVDAGDPDALETVARGAARALHGARLATEAGIELGAEEDRIEREWLDRVEPLAGALGFRSGMSAESVAAAALAALAAAGQNASLAREAVRDELGGLLHRAYAIETDPAGGA